MNGAFYIGAIGLDAQQRALEVIANNIANINTPAFKRSSVRFSELVAPTRNESDMPVAQLDRSAALFGAAVSATPHVWTQGDLQTTGQQLDVAIQGQGFIELLGPSGHDYLWRGGTLKVNPDGYLAASDGTMLRAMISVPQDASSLTIAPNGAVSVQVAGQTASQKIGQIDLVMTKDPDNLVDAGNGYYEAADPSQLYSVDSARDGNASFVQGALEGANVQLADEMTSLLLTQRAFAANAQVVQAGDQLMSIINELRR